MYIGSTDTARCEGSRRWGLVVRPTSNLSFMSDEGRASFKASFVRPQRLQYGTYSIDVRQTVPRHDGLLHLGRAELGNQPFRHRPSELIVRQTQNLERIHLSYPCGDPACQFPSILSGICLSVAVRGGNTKRSASLMVVGFKVQLTEAVAAARAVLLEET